MKAVIYTRHRFTPLVVLLLLLCAGIVWADSESTAPTLSPALVQASTASPTICLESFRPAPPEIGISDGFSVNSASGPVLVYPWNNNTPPTATVCAFNIPTVDFEVSMEWCIFDTSTGLTGCAIVELSPLFPVVDDTDTLNAECPNNCFGFVPSVEHLQTLSQGGAVTERLFIPFISR